MKRARVVYGGRIHSAIVDVSDGADVSDASDGSEASAARLRLADGQVVRFADVAWLPPVTPRTVFALGLNYADHASELAFKPPERPLIFLKGPDAFVGHEGFSACPDDVAQMHFECELAVLIGRGGRHIREAHAYDHVAGYTIANDYALREYLENYYRPNLRVKNRDACTPLGPWLVDASDIADPMSLALRTTVNGEEAQSGNTRDMIFSVPTLIAYLSEFMTLSPGDLILTGTPKGVRYLKPGDRVVTEIERIGRLANTITAMPRRDCNESVSVAESVL
ncbi:fumarylacetoacetate hydrolase family protein [Pararobbsia silviterrae]|uniref:2-hydroxyhepta-2,4-diene-1,7-dioate isomerase n=1 Tax=Pararobbsia silviterrae TaxID=1792498 RepID=A0A494Y5W0_9BURK|nr:fumarylacetoacetate hydrolase family protein [Pararobbsia silviterrae]RKP57673.1 2-hydroxyhepta-2,4-diene-1,7-dioate isomerase [Pararobbsia silviterrae]